MARSSYDTLLSLDHYAKVASINPAHFNQGYGDNIFPLKNNACADLWPQYSWQYSDHASREDLGEAIKGAEDEIADVIGYYPAPKYIEQEPHPFPKHARPDVWRVANSDVRGAHLTITTAYGKVITPGRRATTLVGTATTAGATLVYSLATLTATVTLPTTLTDTCEIQAFFPGESAAPEWRIRPFRSATIAGGVLTIVFDAWLLLSPALQDAFPTAADWGGIDLTQSANYITSIDIYRVYTDTTVASSVFYWEPTPTAFCTCGGSGCAACTLTTQDGCFTIRDPQLGIITPGPASYSDSAWSAACFSVSRNPDLVKVYYLAGEYSKQYLAGRTCNPLSDAWARVIARMATARIDRPFCNCASAQAFVEDARIDLALQTSGGSSHSINDRLLDNPFGTRRGEVEAWRFVSRVVNSRLAGGVW